jgi:hypothetical protein
MLPESPVPSADLVASDVLLNFGNDADRVTRC